MQTTMKLQKHYKVWCTNNLDRLFNTKIVLIACQMTFCSILMRHRCKRNLTKLMASRQDPCQVELATLRSHKLDEADKLIMASRPSDEAKFGARTKWSRGHGFEAQNQIKSSSWAFQARTKWSWELNKLEGSTTRWNWAHQAWRL
jgi:hypothetical protein